MLDSKLIINKGFTVGWLAQKSGADISKNIALDKLMKEVYPKSHKSGRTNYIWLQELFCAASGGLWRYGGQGKTLPDFHMGDKRCEAKSFEIKKLQKQKRYSVHVAASSLFAKNCKTTEFRELLEIDKEKARKFVKENSYDGNDYYLLTGTGALDCEIEDIVLYFVETDLLTKYLTESSNYKNVDMKALAQAIPMVS